MKRAARRFLSPIFCAAVLWAGGCVSATAQATDASLFDRSGQPDVARGWLDLLFRGEKLPGDLAPGTSSLNAVAAALHQALGIYSTGVLVVGGLLLFYNLAVLIVETAHYGVPLGRRSAQVWAPLRLILAISFLVPVSGGLNAGQYLVAWMAKEGSALASNVWDIATQDMKGSLSGLALPRGPDVSGFVAGGIEMEMCRALYRHTYTAFQVSPAVQIAGTIGDIEKLPRTRFAEETWQYSNHLHNMAALCGAYRFDAVRTAENTATGTIGRLNNELADFSREEADKLIARAQPLAQSNLGVFLGDTAGPGIHDDVATLITEHQTALDERLRRLITSDPGVIDQTLGASANAGWITAGSIMFELARLQQTYGALAAHALPSLQSPVLAESDLLHPSLADAIAGDPVLRTYTADQTAPLETFYTQVERSVRLSRGWIYDRQLADMPIVLANPFDLRDQLDTTRDPEAVSSLFGHVFNDAAIAYGVWNNGAAAPYAIPLQTDRPLLALPSAMQSAVTALAEFGRRQVALGNYLFGIAAPDLAPPGTLMYALLLGAVGLCFMASGFALMFVIPLLPFLRFFLGILAWLLSVIEAIVAIPIVALAHLNFTGEGLSGNAARHAYLLWLNILVRPALTLFGFMAGLILFTFGIVFLGMIFGQLTQLVSPAQGNMFVTINVALTFLFTLLACVAANASFKGITLLPDLAFKWLGGFASLPERAETPAAAMPAGSVVAGALPNLTVAPQLLAQQGSVTSRVVTGSESRSAAEARTLGVRSGLFPAYRDPEKPATEAPKSIAHLEKSTGNQPKLAETLRDAAQPRVKVDVERRDVQKPDKRRVKDPNAPAEKKDIQLTKQENVEYDPVPKEPDKNS